MNALQEERTKGYFLAAAKELIRGEGLAVVSTRNVAERAGYSYATLYNYFKDIRDLVFSCVEDFMAECKEFVTKDLSATMSGEKALAATAASYVKFFVQYPGIFDLFYQEKVSQIATKSSNLGEIDSLLDSLTLPAWQSIQKQTKCSDAALLRAQQFHTLSLQGLLLHYLNRRKDIDYKELMRRVNELTQFSAGAL